MAATAALAFSAGPAAATSAAPAPAADKAGTQASAKHGPSSTRIAGYYRSPIACHNAGRIGDWQNRWDSYTCYRVPFGFKRGYFALQVRWDRFGFPGHRPGFPVHHGPGFPHFPLKK
ncbi:hypothetical protein [Paractinoplanes ferrugineus]|nr:hypothetical protein [Actinoplanes ferrugineus]